MKERKKMADLTSRKHKHLTQDECLEIQDCLNHGLSFKAIGKRICNNVSKSTIYRHLKRGYLSVSPLDFPRIVKFKVIMTLNFIFCNFLVGFLLDDKTSLEVAENY